MAELLRVRTEYGNLHPYVAHYTAVVGDVAQLRGNLIWLLSSTTEHLPCCREYGTAVFSENRQRRRISLEQPSLIGDRGGADSSLSGNFGTVLHSMDGGAATE